MAARTRGRMHSGGGADAGDAQRWRRGRGGDAQRWRRGCTGAPPAAARHARHPHAARLPVIRRGPPRPSSAAARHARHPHAARHIRRGPPCPSSARGPPCPSSAAARLPIIRRGPPCPSSAAARHARHPHAARHARHPPRPAVPVIRTRPAMPVIRTRPAVPVIRRGPSSAARSAQTKKAPRGARDVFSDAARARAHTRRAGREKFFRCCAGAYAPPAGASGSVTSPIFSMRSSLTAVRPLRSA